MSILNHIIRTLSFPIFILLHLLFILSSLFLRTYQTFFPSSSESQNSILEDELETTRNRTIHTRHIKPPKHLALIFVPSKKRKNGEKQALIQSILNAVEWSLQDDIQEISIWDGQGLIQSVLPNLMKTLSNSMSRNNTLPLSPPSTPPNEPTQDNNIPELEEPSSPSPQRKQGKDLCDNVDNSSSTSTSLSLGNEVRSIIVYPKSGPSSSKGLKIHFLPPSCSDELISNITKSYIDKNRHLDMIDVKSIDKDIKDQLHFTSDPELLLIHHLQQPKSNSLFKSLLPRSPPELWGYPFWTLRITEIYQYPSPLPLLHHLNPLISTLRSSTLPFLRKLGYSINLPIKLDWQGVLDKEEWKGSMRAWSKVEQRLGK
ncbi:uncharacterized protein L201_000478 [Kwoniella dendrophila CBS 6074]|uniref:ditrans,polycis-polyprenyl diphosphate synthase [(2E,6E)-farnesyldiphosphate specific] n=1 Tax=Kwoniella dendrophila CBS 6074 TaxID=1295534 RepID=A0AAX4JLH1_9TREE